MLCSYISALEPVRSTAHSPIAAGGAAKAEKDAVEPNKSRSAKNRARFKAGTEASFRQLHPAPVLACPDVFCAIEALGGRAGSRSCFIAFGLDPDGGGQHRYRRSFPRRLGGSPPRPVVSQGAFSIEAVHVFLSRPPRLQSCT